MNECVYITVPYQNPWYCVLQKNISKSHIVLIAAFQKSEVE